MKVRLLLVAYGLAASVVTAAPDSGVFVSFEGADEFTDVADSYSFKERGRDYHLKELKNFIERRATARLPEGHRLIITITDVDMAGEFEPWGNPNANDVRVIKDLYPPRIDLRFRLTNAAGDVLAEGERKLRDLGFMYSVRPYDSDVMKYEKELVGRWIVRELRTAEYASS